MTTLKNQIAEWFESENGFFSMQEIIDRFSGYRESDIRDAVRQLCDEGILYGGNFIDDCYGYAGESQDEDEYDCMTEIDTLSNLTSDMFSNVSALAEAMEIDLGTIGDTKYNRYDWTFTQGKRQRGNGWSIAIPDEFSIVPSSEGRTFEAVPSDEVGNMFPFVRVLPGDVVTGVEQFHHPYALKGSIALKKEYVCQQWADNFGFFPEALDVELHDGMGYICVVPLNNGQNFSFQSSLFIGEKMYSFRVDTGLITDTNLEKLKNSVLKWLKTFKVEGNISKKPNMFESAKIISDLKQGRTNTFDKAVDEAQTEYNVAVNGQFQYLHTVAEYMGLEKDAKKIIKDVLLRGMELKEYYYESANKLVEKLKQEQISETTLRKVYLKLKVFEEYQKTVDVDGNNIKVGLSERIKEIQQNWNGKILTTDDTKSINTESFEDEPVDESPNFSKPQTKDDVLKNHKSVLTSLSTYEPGDTHLNEPEIIKDTFDYEGAEAWLNHLANLMDRFCTTADGLMDDLKGITEWDSDTQIKTCFNIELKEYARKISMYLKDVIDVIKSNAFQGITDENTAEYLYSELKEYLMDECATIDFEFSGRVSIKYPVPLYEETLAELEKWYKEISKRNNFGSSKANGTPAQPKENKNPQKRQSEYSKKVAELKKEYERLYPYAGQTEELEKKKAQAESHRRTVINKIEENAKDKQGGMIGTLLFICLSILFISITILSIEQDSFSFLCLAGAFISVVLTIIGLLANMDCIRHKKEFKAEYDSTCENITQLEKQLKEAKKSPTFEEFCEDKYV